MIRRMTVAGAVVGLVLSGCATAGQFANEIGAGISPNADQRQASPARSLVLGQTVQGNIRAADGTVDHTIEVLNGQHFNVIVDAPPSGEFAREVSVSIYKKNRVTGELEDLWRSGYGRSDHGAGATYPVHVVEPGTHVLRVRARDAGAYSIVPQLLEKGSIVFGQAYEGTLRARDDSEDFMLEAQAGQHFTVTLAAPFTGNPDREAYVEIYEKNTTTNELNDLYATAWMAVRDGTPVSTRVIEVDRPTVYVVRVRSDDSGPYTVEAQLTAAAGS